MILNLYYICFGYSISCVTEMLILEGQLVAGNAFLSGAFVQCNLDRVHLALGTDH